MKKILFIFLFFTAFTLVFAENEPIARLLEYDGVRGGNDSDCCCPSYDYGDAPQSYKTYRGTVGNRGARHYNAGPFMGNYWDLEWNGHPVADAEGDDGHDGVSEWNHAVDDEDGVILNGPWEAGTTETIQVIINNFSSSCGYDWYLNVWADFNGNGNWDDPGEQPYDDLIVTPSTLSLDIAVPANCTQFVYLRFRLSSYQNVESSGTVCDGEVEDYRVEVNPPQLGSIGDYVWEELNQDGTQEVFEQGVSQLMVRLYDNTQNEIASMPTDSNGYYLFSDLPAGTYYVGFTLPNGPDWRFTNKDTPSDDALDSDADLVTGMTDPIILAPGENNMTIDAGMYEGDPLPVILSSFTASYQNSGATLLWTTQSESQNSHWNIYRGFSEESDNSVIINFSGIIGAGTTSEPTNYSYNDSDLLAYLPDYDEEVDVWYWLESIDNSGGTELFGPVMISIDPEESDPDAPELTDKFGITSNYPNPFNPDTAISFSVMNDSKGSLTIYNIKGELITRIFQNRELNGKQNYTMNWDGRDSKNSVVSSGIYLIILETDKEFFAKKAVLQK